MTTVERRTAIAELLAKPDPPELRRGHRLRLHGKPERYSQIPILSACYVQAQLLALHERRAELDLDVLEVEVARAPQRELRVVPVAA